MRKLDNRIKHITTEFDYIPRNYDRSVPARFYELPVRIVRFKVKDTYKVIMTNLPRDSFPAIKIKKLYGRRWGIEMSFRDLRHTIGLNYYHSKKTDSIIQRKFAYRINLSQAVQICREFLKHKVRVQDIKGLMEAHILPIRKGRNNRRIKGARRDVYINYRIA